MNSSAPAIPAFLGTKAPTLSKEDIRAIEPVLMGFAYRAVRREDLARDLVQETYVAALESLGSFAGRSTLRTWMVGILSRKIIDHYRRTRREVVMDATPEPDPADITTTSPARAPDADIDQRTAMTIVERALGELTEYERMAVLLCDVEHLDREEACNAMHVQPTHLRVLLHRGRNKLRQALEHAGLQADT